MKTCALNAKLDGCVSPLTFALETAAQLKLSNAAEVDYEKQIVIAKASAEAKLVTDNLTALKALLAESQAFVASGAAPLTKAIADYNNWLGLIVKEKGDLAKTVQAKLAKIVECEAEQYNAYVVTLNDNVKARGEAIAEIVKILDARAKPAKGAAGWRCEKGLSNGTFRPMRNEKTCATDLCCGAAKVVPDKS